MNLADSLGIAALVVGVIAVLVGVAYGRARGRPVYKQTGNTVVTASPEKKITVQHAGSDVPRVTRTLIAFWNAGYRTLNKSDVVKDYPIRFTFHGEGSKVLAVTMLGESEQANLFKADTVEGDGTSVLVTFDYLDNRQGGIFEVLHTSERWGAICSGKVKGLPSGAREIKSVRARIAGVLLFLLAYTFTLGTVAIVHSEPLGGILIGIVIIGSMLLGLYLWRTAREPKRLSLSRK